MRARRKPLGSLLFLLLGAASAVVGLIPWLITGLRLPLQNLWATETTEMPVALLPFSQYYIFLIVSLIVIGSTIAGIIGRVTAAEHPASALFALIGGVVVVQLLALVQTAMTVSAGLSDRAASGLYLAALIAASVTSIVLGVGVLALLARAPKAGALLGVSVAAIALGTWLGAIVRPVGVVVSPEPLVVISHIVTWLPGVIVGAAIAWAGISSAVRAIAAVVSLLVLWIGTAAVIAVSAAAGTRVLAPYPAEMLDYGVSVFRSALFTEGAASWQLIPAIATAFVGLVARSVIARRSARTVVTS